jgi:hypothetical protein
VRYEEFEERAHEEWERIPEAYKRGVDGLIVDRSAKTHPSIPDVYTLGECLTETYPSAFGGPDTIRSAVVLYYGSFLRLSRQDESFDWHEELWETLTHELQHHLESLAADEGLLDVDYAMDENFKRAAGEPFDVTFYRAGVPLGGGWYEVEDEYFFETEQRFPRIEFEWEGSPYAVEPEASHADVLFLHVADGVTPPPRALCVVSLRPTGWRDTLRSLLRGGRTTPETEERDVVARRIERASEAGS